MTSRDAAEARVAQTLLPVEPHPWRAFFLQTTLSWAALVAIEIVSTVIENPPFDGGMASIGWPIGGAIAAVFTNLVAVTLGLPFRLVRPLNRWIRAHRIAALATAAIGLIALVVSFALGHPNSATDDAGQVWAGFEPNEIVYLIGWLLVAIGLTHTWTDYMQRELPNQNPPAGAYPIPPVR